ncbi:MAG: TRAP transporter substrate-binding protein, partial [Proteobacteria bacterium]|nr:TRAP transporter substrate-binding protein [Pseudomonadota bacterium]
IPWAEKIEKDSGGRLKVQPFWAMQLGGGAPQLLDQARDGVVDIVWTLPGFTAGRIPEVEPFELPFVHRDALSTTLALQDFQDRHSIKALGDYHTLLLHAHQGFLFQTKNQVHRMEDLKGMKLRAASRAGVWLLEALGATGIGMPLPKIPEALSKGVIDGVTLPYEIAPAVKTPDLVSHFTSLAGPQPRLGTNVFAFLMNEKAYAALPDDLKKVIDANAGRNIAEMAGKNWIAVEEPGLNAVKSKPKNELFTLPESEVAKIKAAAEPVFKRWYDEVGKSGIDGPALVKDARDLIEKYAGAS